MINYGKQSIDRKDISEVLKVLKSGWLTQGPQINKFELAIRDSCEPQQKTSW